MLAQMTGGARGRIVVDEDFEIQVDGQPLNTLSGSGKVCANLAVRLGLGRILTNGVFPVFMGDEMDASMDNDRAGHLHDALCALEGKLTQILVITHKRPACSRVITLEN
jgi:DNA repair exonuclease SbcCD ATPase subunit